MEVDKQFIELYGKISFFIREVENKDKNIVDLKNKEEI